jgi:putative phage-type endonuclease
MDRAKYNAYLNYLLSKYNVRDVDVDVEFLLKVVSTMIEYIDDNILQLMYTDLYESVYDYSLELMKNEYIDSNILENIYGLSKEESIKILERYLKMGLSLVFKYVIPKRSYSKSYIRSNKINYVKIDNQLEKLKSIIQPEQRSDEWYIFRNSTLTASNIWKIFVSDYSQTQLILEKCEPLDINKFKVTNTNSPLHWGQKYEPVSILYYEYIHNTKVSEFGCIPHKDYSFIAASPDGIICDGSSNLFGRMLEIKNVVSREITGIPKMEYWIQMQLQMEVCNLNECDFLETKFIQYDTEEEYREDKETEYKGIILQYLKDESPYYVYAPFMLIDLDSEEYKRWEDEEKEKNKDLELIARLYWKLVKISCVLVLRNKIWFKKVQPMIEIFWNNLVKERESGKYKERIVKKRKLALEDAKSKSDFPMGGCLINPALFNKEEKVENTIISVNTEVI